MKRFAIPITIFLILSSLELKSENLFENSYNNLSKNSIFINITSIIIFDQLGIYYDRIIEENWSIKLGASVSVSMGPAWRGGEILLNYFSSGSNKIEFGLGAGVYIVNPNFGSSTKESGIAPLINTAYRYQPAGSGLFFRTGISSSFFIGNTIIIPGISLSFGYAF
ncbi:MAG: hypothetical protein NT007_05220 [Candidatus Kapabacteria bacterium]|nr:hypothetical protein [Candidatus Kapabacteria bacterium]